MNENNIKGNLYIGMLWDYYYIMIYILGICINYLWKINNFYEIVYGFLRIEYYFLLSMICLGFLLCGYDVDDVII